MVDGEVKPNETGNEAEEKKRDSDKDIETDAQKSGKRMDTSNILTLFFSLCLVVAAFLTFLAICVQAFIYNAQLREMKKSTDAATKAAKAAEDSVTLARENAQLDQRAWVSVESVRLVKPLSVGEEPVVSIVVKNSGRTPAQRLACISNLYIAVDRVPENETGIPAGQKSEATIGPTTTFEILTKEQPRIKSQMEIDEIKSGRNPLFVTGIISYVDVFQKSHRTDFCWVFYGASLDRLNAVSWSTGNSSD
jgi:hypothetical protein